MSWEQPRIDALVADVFGYNALQLGLPQFDLLAQNRIPLRQIAGESGKVDVVVVGSYVNITSETATATAPRAFVEFVDALRRRGAKVIVVSFGTPYLLMQGPAVGT